MIYNMAIYAFALCDLRFRSCQVSIFMKKLMSPNQKLISRHLQKHISIVNVHVYSKLVHLNRLRLRLRTVYLTYIKVIHNI